MAKRHYDDLFSPEDEDVQEFFGADVADQAFWDEFWSLEEQREEYVPPVTITIRNEETGEERIIENVRLRFRTLRKLRG